MFWNFIHRMNLWLAVAVVFALHLVLYLVLRTDHWLIATLSATVVYGIVFTVLKMVATRRGRGVL